MVARFVEKVLRRARRIPVARGDQQVGHLHRQIADHVFETVPAVTVDDHQPPHALRPERRRDVGEDRLLRFVTGMDAERQFALPGVLRTHAHGRQHHAAHTAGFEGLPRGIHGNVVRKDAVRQVRQMQVVRLRRTPRQVVLQVADPAVAGFRKVYFPVHHSMLSVFGRRTVSCMKSASARTAAIRANPSPRLPPSAQPPRTFVTTAPAKTPVMFITP